MRRVVFAVALTSIALVAVPGAAAAPDPQFQQASEALVEAQPTALAPSNANGDSVHGAGRFENATLAISASSGPLGEDASGRGVAVTGGQGNTQIRFEVTCLAVAGNLASLGGVVVGGDLLPEGTEVIVLIRDSGLSGGAGDGQEASVLPANTCPAFVAAAAGVPPIDHGNYHVRDAIG